MTQHSSQIEPALAADSWQHWEGQVVNGQFPLLRYLGGSRHSAVFLTNREGTASGTPTPVAIKLILDAPGSSDAQIKKWELAASLSHPNLLAVFHSGRCLINGSQMLFVVTEYAEEDLAQILPQRALSPSETREMLRPALDALAYLHGTGLVHGHIKPSNIMACGDQVKLSADSVRIEGEPAPAAGDPDPYRPPENKYSPALDSWALGMTLVEVLTQHLPPASHAGDSDPMVPGELEEPFLQIARGCLRRNPELRLKGADIESLLNPAQPEPSPLAPPAPPRQQTASAASAVESSSNFHSLAWLVSIGLFFVAIGITSIRSKHSRLAAEKATPQAIGNSQRQILGPQEPSNARASVLPGEQQKKLHLQPRPIVQVPREKKKLAVNSDQPDAIHQVLPEVPQKIRNTIHGTVRINVSVIVDAAGRVSQAELASPGPSRYFADRALQSARQWTFPPFDQGGPHEWVLHFAFSSADTQAHAVPSAR